MIEELFAQGDSFLHRRDPRGKVVAALCFTVTVALLNSFAALWPALVLSLFLVLLARLPLLSVLKRMLLVNGFTLFLWISLPLTYGGGQLIETAFFNLSRDGIELAALITLKTNTIVLTIIALLTTSTVAELGSALDKLRFSKKICFLLLYSYRYVFVIYQEYARLLRAAKLRSFSPGTNLHTYRTFGYLFGMTLVKSYNRSRRIHQAMLLRGFDGRLVSLYSYRFGKIDVVFVSFIALAVISVILLNITY